VTNKKATATSVVENSGSKEDIIKGQRSDPVLKVIRGWLEKDLKPDWQEICRYGPTVKGYWLQWDLLADGKRFVCHTVVPNCCKENVLRELHDTRGGRHYAVNQTLARIRD